MQSSILSLDERWLEFLDHTTALFEAHPFMIPPRQQLFKSLLAANVTLGLRDVAKNALRHLRYRSRSVISAESVDVVFWIDSPKAVMVDNVMAVYGEMKNQDLKTMFIVTPVLWEVLKDKLPPSTVIFRPVFPRKPQPRWYAAWDDFYTCCRSELLSKQKGTYLSWALWADAYEMELNRLFEVLQPRILLTASDHYMPASSACFLAGRRGIRSVVIQHGIVQAFYTPLIAENMVVWGQTTYDTLSELHVPSHRLHILGCPRYDHLKWREATEAASAFRQTLGLPPKPTLVFFSNGNDAKRNGQHVLEACAQWLEQAAGELRSEANILVRLHPNENGELYAGMNNLRVFKSECDLFLTLGGADVIGSLCSTALVEALLYKKPVLQFYADGWPELADNWKQNLATRIASAGDLTQELRRLFQRDQNNNTSQNIPGEAVFANQGHASQAVAAYLYSIL